MPKRIQRKREKGWRMPPNTIYVGRPTRWGNQHSLTPASKLDSYSRVCAVESFKLDAERILEKDPEWIDPLLGKDLACWCKLCSHHQDGKEAGVECKDCAPCHVDPLLELANS